MEYRKDRARYSDTNRIFAKTFTSGICTAYLLSVALGLVGKQTHVVGI